MSHYVNPPFAAYSNVPIKSDYYSPGRFVITAISMGLTTTVTTAVPHNYVIGQLVRLDLTPGNRCRGINKSTSYVISIPSTTQVVLQLYSQGENAFVANPSNSNSYPQIVAVGDINSGQQNASGRTQTETYIPGSFINISPQ